MRTTARLRASGFVANHRLDGTGANRGGGRDRTTGWTTTARRPRRRLPAGCAIDTDAAHQLWASGARSWIDVLPAPRRPENLPPSAVWMPLPHRDIPGSLWLPDVGRGALSPSSKAIFATISKRRPTAAVRAPVVFYCLADCWMSWNATKRAAGWGYTQLYWYRDGTTGGRPPRCRPKRQRRRREGREHAGRWTRRHHGPMLSLSLPGRRSRWLRRNGFSASA